MVKGADVPSLLAYAVDLSKDSQAGKPSSLFGLAFFASLNASTALRLLALIGAQLLRQVAKEHQPPLPRHDG